eukprot:m.135211 g.135211  ORF g.135211 m.135211 type:complete len:435 (-) comp22577_c0_seq1:222-1526(-)
MQSIISTASRTLSATVSRSVAPSATFARRTLSDEAAALRPDNCHSPTMMEIGTRRPFTEDHDIVRQSCRRWWEQEVVPHHAQWEKDGQISRECWESAGANGFLAMTTPEDYGGYGGSILDANIMWEEQSYSGCTGPGFAIHSDICGPYVVNHGTEEQKHMWLPGMVEGKKIAALGMTEPSAGSDLQGMRTTATRDGDDWVINGSKVFITNGQMCDLLILAAKTDPDAAKPAAGMSLFLVDTSLPGFSRGQNLDKIGMKAQDTSELFFEDLRVPHSALLGTDAGMNRGFYMMMQELPQERLLIASMGVAAAEACFEMTRDYVKERKAFGTTLFKGMQTIRHELAEIKTEVAVGRAFYDNCLMLHNEGRLDSQMASMAKYYCTDLQNKTANRCLQLFGGWGYMTEYPIARAFIDGRVQQIYGGANEVMKELIARSI